MGVAEAAATASASVSTIAGPAEAADFAEEDDDTVAALVALTLVRGAAAVAVAESGRETVRLDGPAVSARPAWRAGRPGRAGRGRRIEEETGSDVVGCAVPPGEPTMPASTALWAPAEVACSASCAAS